jgi:hypothetical protein
MAVDKAEDKQRKLRDRVRALIASDFEDMSTPEVVAVLTELAGEIDVESSQASQPAGEPSSAAPAGSWTNSIANRITDPVVPEESSREGSTCHVRLRVDGPAEVAGVLHQALEVGALLVEFEESPQLNDLVTIDLELPESHLSVETQGRVVHTSASGTAIEVSQLSREDRAALETILDDHREFLEHDQPPSAVETSEQSYADTQRIEADPEIVPDAEPTTGKTLQGRPELLVEAPTDDTEEQDIDAFTRNKRPSSSVVLGALIPQGRRGDFSVRREVELTDPDLRVLTSPQRALRQDPWEGKTFGPERAWIEPTASPDRVEALAEERIVDVLLQLSGSGFTGLLEMEGEEWERQIYFDGGLAVEATLRPREPGEELGPMLHMADRIDDQQLAMAAAHAEENETTFERSLLELEVLDHDRIRHAIAGRLTYLLRQICDVDGGEVRVFDSDSLPAGYLPAPPLRVHVPVERIIYKRFFERLKLLETDERDTLVAGHLDAYPEVGPSDRDRIERVVLAEEHDRLVERIISGRRRLREVFTESNLSPAETFAVVYALHRMGVLRFDTSLHQTIVRERFRENVTVKYLSVHKASYFEVLNVHWSSYDEVIEKAYVELIDQFDPDSVPEAMEEEVHERVGEIRDRIESAFKVLAEREQRHAYRKRIMPEYKLAHAIPLFMKQAELAERRSQWTEALDSLRRVLEIEPDNDKASLRFERIQQMQDGRLSANPAESSF